MARHKFGEPLSDDDVLEVQGIDYPMVPIGMRAMRKLLTAQKANPNRKEDDPLTEADLDLALEIVVSAVRPDVRDKFKQHIEDSVPPTLVVQIATAVMSHFSDLDPTQVPSSLAGSPQTGLDSTAGALPAAQTPTPSAPEGPSTATSL
jgi:hypothetical protein